MKPSLTGKIHHAQNISPDALTYLGKETSKIQSLFRSMETRYNALDDEQRWRFYRTLLHALDWRLPSTALERLLTYGPLTDMTVGALSNAGMTLLETAGNGDVSKSSRQNKYLKTLFSMAFKMEIEPVLLYLADHIAGMESIPVFQPAGMRRLCEDCETIFIPLTDMLGLWRIRRRLLSLVLKVNHPKKIRRIKQRRREYILEYKEKYIEVRDEILNTLHTAGIAAGVKRHLNYPGSMYYKWVNGVPITRMIRNVRFDVFTESEHDCYRALGIIHGKYPPHPQGAIKDLIAAPKYNGYRTLATTVKCSSNDWKREIPVEFRIASWNMHQVNEMGIIHVMYPGGSRERIRNAWWEHESPRKNNTIHVFSPTGEVYWLPQKSTPLDYAYQVHTDIGNGCRKIWINGECLETDSGFSRELQSGDLVKVEFEPGTRIDYNKWLQIVTTEYAKTQIRQAIRRQRVSTHKGRSLIEKLLSRELALYQLPSFTNEEIDKGLESVRLKEGFTSLEGLYTAVADGKKSPDKIVDHLITRFLSRYIADNNGTPVNPGKYRIQFAKFNLHRVRYERVIPEFPIVGKIRKTPQGPDLLRVYRSDWAIAPRGNEAVPLTWALNKRPTEMVEVTIEAVDRPKILSDILAPVYHLYEQGAYLMKVKAEVKREQTARIRLFVNLRFGTLLENIKEILIHLRETGLIDTYRLKTLSFFEQKRFPRRGLHLNPYSSLPVMNPRVFKGRDGEIEEIFNSLHENNGENMMVVFGTTRVGKTSLLRHIELHVAESFGFFPVFIDMLSFETKNSSAFWFRLASRISESVSDDPAFQNRKYRLLWESLEGDAVSRFLQYMDLLGKAPSQKRFLVIIDEFTAIFEDWEPTNAADMHRNLKAVLDLHRPDISFLICVQKQYVSEQSHFHTGRMNSSIFTKGRFVPLKKLDKFSAGKLIREPMGETLLFDNDIVDQIRTVSGCHPYVLQKIMGRIVETVKNRMTQPLRLERRRITREILETAICRELECGDITFYDFWQKCGILEKRILLQAAQNDYFDIDNDTFPHTNNHDIRESIRFLVTNDLLEHLDGKTNENRFTVSIPLFQRWLKETSLLL